MRKLIAAICLGSTLLVSCAPGVGWMQIHPRTSPPPLASNGFAYDTRSQEGIVFGGLNSTGWSDQTWIWNGSDWRQFTTGTMPPAREKAAMAYDPVRDQVVMFGGRHDKTLFDDTWEWDGKSWKQLQPRHSPPARCCHAMAYDALQHSILMTGGWDANANLFYSDTWAWDGTDWRLLKSSGGQLAAGHMLVWSALDGEIIMTPSGENANTWRWYGDDWIEIGSRPDPSRSDGTSVYDAGNDSIVLFGGSAKGTAMNDLWAFDGQAWKPIAVGNAPPARFAQSIFYDMKRQSIVLFGGAGQGGTLLNDTWELKLPRDWVVQASPKAPTPVVSPTAPGG